MPKRFLYGLGAVLLIVSVVLVAWQGSFSGNFGSFAPDDAEQTFVYYGISILIFLLMVTLGFMLVRLIVKLWIERQRDRVGSRIRTQLVVGALALSLMPVFFMVLFSVYVLNATLQKWFDRPVEHELVDLVRISGALDRSTRDKANAEAELLAGMPETKALLSGGAVDSSWLGQFCRMHGVLAVEISSTRAEKDKPTQPPAGYGRFPGPKDAPSAIGRAAVTGLGADVGSVRLAIAVPIDVAKEQKTIQDYDSAFLQLSAKRKFVRTINLLVLAVIALFIFFVTSWLAHLLARQISGPIAALLRGVEEVSQGNLGHQIKVNAVDELAQLVSGFNRMTADLEANRTEIEARRRFTEAILESIPTGVISVDSAGAIQRVNKALEDIFPELAPRKALRLDDLFSREDAAEIRYLMNRARRTGHAARQLEVKKQHKTLHLAITVAAIEGRRGSGFVIVVEDTSDLLRAQKTAAWGEVARRVAHEIKNPLTPITLSAERILRQVNRMPLHNPMNKVVRECAETILEETASVKRLVDEFSQFSRLPAAQPVLCELNDIVGAGIGVFEGRLDGIELRVDFASDLPSVLIDPEQFKRVVVNLIDNAAEAMQDSPRRELHIQTRSGLADSVEIIFADTGCGITPDQKEKLFLPYFSTKGRGTGLGLAIVSHILKEHGATIRVEDNKPCGAWFTIEVPAAGSVAKQPLTVNAASV
jgi:PAS domain S-box-containing protein